MNLETFASRGMKAHTAVDAVIDQALESGQMTIVQSLPMPPGLARKALTAPEASALRDCEEVIERNQRAFLETAEALAKIRDGWLYRQTHNTFEDYCRQRWGFTARRARQLVSGAGVMKNLKEVANPQSGTTVPPIAPAPMPTSERQVRSLASLPKAEQQQAWKEAVKSAPDEQVTTRHVEQAVEKIKESKAPKNSTADRELLDRARDWAVENAFGFEWLLKHVLSKLPEMEDGAAKRFIEEFRKPMLNVFAGARRAYNVYCEFDDQAEAELNRISRGGRSNNAARAQKRREKVRVSQAIKDFPGFVISRLRGRGERWYSTGVGWCTDLQKAKRYSTKPLADKANHLRDEVVSYADETRRLAR